MAREWGDAFLESIIGWTAYNNCNLQPRKIDSSIRIQYIITDHDHNTCTIKLPSIEMQFSSEFNGLRIKIKLPFIKVKMVCKEALDTSCPFRWVILCPGNNLRTNGNLKRACMRACCFEISKRALFYKIIKHLWRVVLTVGAEYISEYQMLDRHPPTFHLLIPLDLRLWPAHLYPSGCWTLALIPVACKW